MSETQTQGIETNQADREASGARPYGRYLEDFEVGAVYKHWPAKTVTEADDHLFCLLTMNHHPLHINDVYAAESLASTSRTARSWPSSSGRCWSRAGSRPRRGAGGRRAVLLKVLYWAAVVAISLALVVGLILFLESRDQSSVESDSALPARLT
jgi:MaoC like domain